MQIDWKAFEPTPGEYRFDVYDRIYAADLAHGVRPLFILAFAPAWARGDACAAVSGTCHAGPAPAFYDEFARALAAIADRYPGAAGVEVWNEPNSAYFWRPAPDPAAYAALLEAAYAAVKAVDPSMTVAGGAVVNTDSDGGSIGIPWFLKGVFDAGAADAMDVISMHAYAPTDVSGDLAVREVDSVRTSRDWWGDPSTPIWITETGTTTTGSRGVSEAIQAEMVETLQHRLSSEADVEMVLFHTLIEPASYGPTHSQTGFGVLRHDFTPKPAGCALAIAWLRLDSCPANLLS
ncbi:MAG: cellulase family glycosylhydrolase [Solirubrobacterales bacterium]